MRRSAAASVLLALCALAFCGAARAAAAQSHPLRRNLAYASPYAGLERLALDVDGIAARIDDAHAERAAPAAARAFVNEAEDIWQAYDPVYGVDGAKAYRGTAKFAYGVASGDPDSSSAILWTHAEPAEDSAHWQPVCVWYDTATDDAFENVVDSNYAWGTSDVDYAVKVMTTGLQPLTSYYFRFRSCFDDANVSPTGMFHTFPSPTDAPPSAAASSLKIAVFSCSNYPWGYFLAYRHAAADSSVDYAMHVGDYLYEPKGDGSADSYGDGRDLGRVPKPNKEIYTIDDYRLRYKTYRSDPDLQELHRVKAWLITWDDHEIADNTWIHGDSALDDADVFVSRKYNATRAHFEWLPTRTLDATDGWRIWRNFSYGDLADLVIFDTRQYERDVTDVYVNTAEVQAMSNDTKRSMLGAKQERWAYDALYTSKQRGSAWRMIVQGLVMNQLSRPSDDGNSYVQDLDAWDGYKANRRRLFNTLVDNQIDNVIVVSGDSHANWVYDTIYEEWINDTSRYDPGTGEGSFAVEFAGTAVSSPSSYGADETPAYYTDTARRLCFTNRNLQFTEGETRGYFDVEFTPTEVNANYWGFKSLLSQNSPALKIATFNVKSGANRLTRPINSGNAPVTGVVQSQVVSYNDVAWNGTGFS